MAETAASDELHARLTAEPLRYGKGPMKVLARCEETFAWRFQCGRCGSILEAESSDLLHMPCDGDDREHWPEKFNVACAVCGQVIGVPEKEIPEFVKRLARERGKDSAGPGR